MTNSGFFFVCFVSEPIICQIIFEIIFSIPGDPRDRRNVRLTYRKVEKILLLTQMASHLKIQWDAANIFS